MSADFTLPTSPRRDDTRAMARRPRFAVFERSCSVAAPRHTRCTDSHSMNATASAEANLEPTDVPESSELGRVEDPFEDVETGEIILLDVMRVDLCDIEIL